MRYLVIVVCCFCLLSCSTISPIITQMASQGYEENLKLGTELLKEWSYYNGVIDGAGVPILDHQTVVAMQKLTTLAKEQNVYTKAGYAAGYASGLYSRLTVKTVEDLADLLIEIMAKFGILAL